MTIDEEIRALWADVMARCVAADCQAALAARKADDAVEEFKKRFKVEDE